MSENIDFEISKDIKRETINIKKRKADSELSIEQRFEFIIRELSSLNAYEMNELNKRIKLHFDLSEAVTVSAVPASSQEAKEERPSEVAIILKSLGGNQLPIPLLQVIAKHTGKGLVEVAKATKNLPFTISDKIAFEEAQKIKEQLTEKGAEVEIK